MAEPVQGADVAAGNNQSARKRLFGLYRWYSRANSANDWGQWLWSLFASKAGAGTAAAVLASGAAVAVVQPELVRGWLAPAAVKVETQRWTDSSVVFPVVGTDKAGRHATFDIVVLTKDYNWARGSDIELTRAGRPLIEADAVAQVLGSDVKAGLSRSGDVIAVGVASEEGQIVVETARAERRARTAARWLADALPQSTRLWLLNLGQYRTDCGTPDTSDSSWQRPFMMIGVRQKEPDVKVAEALTNALSGKSNLPSPDCYSSFTLTSLR